MSYHFEELGDERFQRLAQSLIVKVFPNAQCFPVGQPDGGRDAILRTPGKRNAEILVFQVKFSRNPALKTERDAIEEVIKTEKEKVTQLKKQGAQAYYLITNVSGTAHPSRGSIDKVNALLSQELSVGLIRNYTGSRTADVIAIPYDVTELTSTSIL